MTLANAIVLHKHFKAIGREVEAAQLERRHPELKKKSSPTSAEKVVDEGVEKNGKK